MAFNLSQEQFDAANEAANAPRDFTPVPDGKYCVSILEVEDTSRMAKSGNEIEYLKFQFKHEGGEYSNRREFDDLVYSNSGSPQHGEIGRRRIAQLWSSVGGEGLPSLASFVGKVGTKFELVIKTVPSKDPQYGPKRQFYFNPCSESCSASPAEAPSDGGDIWS
jgi:hypothetical protein